MLAYSVIMFLGAAVFSALSAAVYRGRTGLIHDYHQARVKDKAAYGRAFGKALSCFALGMLLSGIIGLFARTPAVGTAAVAVLLIGVCAGIVRLVEVQRKFNNGVF